MTSFWGEEGGLDNSHTKSDCEKVIKENLKKHNPFDYLLDKILKYKPLKTDLITEYFF